MTPHPRPSLWRLLLLAVVLAVVLANVGLDAANQDGAFDDFVPQWTLGHLAATGHRADTYDFATQAALVTSIGLPPHQTQLLKMPQIAGIGICPYPPTFALVYAPVCRLPFQEAGLVVYFASVGLALVTAWAVAGATGGRLSGLPAAIVLPFHAGIQFILPVGQASALTMLLVAIGVALAAAWAVGQTTGGLASGLTAAIVILCYPGFESNLHLGQNSLVTLALWALGWRELVRRRDLAAGLWWGLLAYKIHWLLAVGWVPLVVGRPRVLLGMAASAGALAAAATALLGPDAWARWLSQVAAVDRVFATDPGFRERILPLGCDLRSVVNRYLVPEVGRPVGWLVLAAVAGVTAVWYRRRPAADPTGPEGAGLLFAAGLTAPHLYFYDETVFLLPLLVLWSHRAALARWQVAVLIGLTVGYYFGLRYMFGVSGALDGPPVWMLVVVVLWVFSLWMFRGRAPKREERIFDASLNG